MEDYTTGTGQKIKVHDKDKCEGEYCCIHNPSDHIMKDWPTHCIGHPDPDDLAFKERNGFPDADGIHGCDGCCTGEKFEKLQQVETFTKEEFEI